MNREKLVLNNGTEITIETGSGLSDIKVVSGEKAEMIATWDQLTEENLKTVQIRNGDGAVIGAHENLLLESETSTIQKDGTILTRFQLREKTEVELLRERVEHLESGQEVQNGAIDDLGTITSALAEAQEGGRA